MDIAALVLVIGLILSATAAFLWLAFKVKDLQAKPPSTSLPQEFVQQIITPEFMADIKAKILTELTRSMGGQAEAARKQLTDNLAHLHEHIADELRHSIDAEFNKYQESINNAKDLLVTSATKGQESLREQQQTILKAYEHDLEVQKHARITQLDERLADIITQYVLSAVGRQTEGKDQLAAILRDLEDHKQQITEDMRS